MNKYSLVGLSALLTLLVFVVVLIGSCSKSPIKYNDTTLVRPCETVTCLNGGTCVDGYCHCPEGYEGLKCETRWNEKFTGTFILSDECYTGTDIYYEANIAPNTQTANRMVLSNVGVFCGGSSFEAIINPEKTSFYIPLQNTCGDLYLSGYGNMSTNMKYINLFLTSRDSANHTSTHCSIIMNKKP